jgi:hypothetical protein
MLHDEDRWTMVAYKFVNSVAEIYDPVCKSEDHKIKVVVKIVVCALPDFSSVQST